MKKLIIVIIALITTAPVFSIQTGDVIYNFDFEKDLDGFTATTGTWVHSSKSLFSFANGEFNNRTGGFIVIDSEDSKGKKLDASVSSPSLNVAPAAQLILEFDHYFKQSGPEKGLIEVSSDNGMSWKPVREYSGRTFRGHDLVHLNTSFEGAPDKIRVRFRYSEAKDSWFWSLDNVKLTSINSAQVFSESFLLTSEFKIQKFVEPEINFPEGFDCCTVNYELVLVNHNLESGCFSYDLNGNFDFFPGAVDGFYNSNGFFEKNKSTEKIKPGGYGSLVLSWADRDYYAAKGRTVLTIDITNILKTKESSFSYYVIAKYNGAVISQLK